MDLLRKLNSGGKTALCLAPMAGFSDRAMRLVAHEEGADYAVTEMISAKAVVFGDKKTYALARVGYDEGEVGLQIFGSEPSVMAEGTAKLLEHADRVDSETGFRSVLPAAIDINMGCPVPKVYKNGEGSALMQSPEKIFAIVRAVVGSAMCFGLPVSVKMRSGISPECRNAEECVFAAEEGGASWITLHPRTRVELYGGKADRDYAGIVKKTCHIPMIYSGDIDSAESAQDALDRTGADGLMLGRGAVGNPFLFAEIRARLEGRPYAPPTLEERKAVALRQLRYAVIDKGEYTAVSESRKQIARYFCSFRGCAALRAAVNVAKTCAEIEAALAALDAVPSN